MWTTQRSSVSPRLHSNPQEHEHEHEQKHEQKQAQYRISGVRVRKTVVRVNPNPNTIRSTTRSTTWAASHSCTPRPWPRAQGNGIDQASGARGRCVARALLGACDFKRAMDAELRDRCRRSSARRAGKGDGVRCISPGFVRPCRGLATSDDHFQTCKARWLISAKHVSKVNGRR